LDKFWNYFLFFKIYIRKLKGGEKKWHRRWWMLYYCMKLRLFMNLR
jgi:hypothetical protein